MLRKIKLSEIGEVVSGGTPKTSVIEYWNGDIPWITPKDLSNFSNLYIDEGERNITDKGLVNSSAKLLPKGTILFSSRAPIGYIAIANRQMTTNQGFKNIVVNKNHNNVFIYYLLKNNIGYIESLSNGSTFKEISGSVMKNLEFEVPPLQEQKAIAHILSTLDEKIETNNKINKTLEEMAQAIFKHWFVDFEFPNEDGEPYKSSGGDMIESELGPIPKGWEVGKIGNYMKVKSGYAFKSQWWTDEGIPVVKIKNLANGIVDYNDVGYVSVDKVSLAKDFIVKSGDILIAMTGATIGKIGLVYEFSNIVLVNQRVGKFFIGDDPFMKLPFAYVLLTNNRINEEIISLGGGSAQPNVSPSQIESIKIPFPLDNKIEIFNDLLNSSFRKLVENIKENERLKQLRDALLPKLMSGEIRVPIDNEE